MAEHQERNNIIVLYHPPPEEEGFTASGSRRMGVAEMTRYGMTENRLPAPSQFICDTVAGMRKDFRALGSVLTGIPANGLLETRYRRI